MSILRNKLSISKVEVDQPYFKLLIDNKGNLLSRPLRCPKKRQVKTNKKGKEKRDTKDQQPKNQCR